MCKHDFQPTLVPSKKHDLDGLKVWCMKCNLQLTVEQSDLVALEPISERVREVVTVH